MSEVNTAIINFMKDSFSDLKEEMKEGFREIKEAHKENNNKLLAHETECVDKHHNHDKRITDLENSKKVFWKIIIILTLLCLTAIGMNPELLGRYFS